MQFDNVKDSGKRQEYTTGSRRDTQDGKGRPDLIPVIALRRLAQHYENGAKKYGDRNWEKGQPLSRYYSSCQRHLWAFLEGDYSEDHLAAVMWNVAALIHHIDAIMAGKLPKELDDINAIDAITTKQAIDKLNEYTDTKNKEWIKNTPPKTQFYDTFSLQGSVRTLASGQINDVYPFTCATCYNNRKIECPECRGSNKVYNNREQCYTTCDYCDGKCFIPCKVCT